MNLLKASLFFCSFLFLQTSFLKEKENSFNPDAGHVEGMKPLVVKASSNSENVDLMRDGNAQTYWESEALLPTGFVNKIQTNFLFKNSSKVVNRSIYKNIENAFDGNLDTAADIGGGDLKINLLENKNLSCLFLKVGAKTEVKILGRLGNGYPREIQKIATGDNYKWLNINLLDKKVTSLILRSSESFQLFEIAANYSGFKERVQFDFGKNRKVKYLNLEDNREEGTIKKMKIFTSENAKNKEEIQYEIIRKDWIELEEEKQMRYILLEYEMIEKEWQKVRINELKAYDKNGLTGKKMFANSSTIPLKEMLGVNGYWSFGRGKYSKFATEGDGVDLYVPFSSHIRNYHDMTWDLNAADEAIDFEKMASGKGTPAKEWLNWDLEYGDWIKTGVNIQASLQFFRFPDKSWNNPYQSAYNYAYAFARHFGPTHGNGMVCTIEIGNEPWHYDAAIYKQILLGMAKGAKAADASIEVFPCALQAADPSVENKDGFKNYIGARLPKEVLPYLDGINTHCYSYDSHNTHVQKALQPEAANSVFWEILNSIRWRNMNMPGKKIYLSEWGWDSRGGGEDCTHNQCVSEEDAAAFAIRGALIAHRLGVDRASWFYYANEEGESRLYARSGLTSSKTKEFQKKLTFYAFENMAENLGELYFISVYKENEEIWGYWYGDGKGNKTHLILWRPVMNDSSKKSFSIKLNRPPKEIFEMPLNKEKTLLKINFENGILELPIGGIPLLIKL